MSWLLMARILVIIQGLPPVLMPFLVESSQQNFKTVS